MVSEADNRSWNVARPVRLTPAFTRHAEGSVLIECGDTKVICTASVEEKIPSFLRGSGLGWVTANMECSLDPPDLACTGKPPEAGCRVEPRKSSV